MYQIQAGILIDLPVDCGSYSLSFQAAKFTSARQDRADWSKAVECFRPGELSSGPLRVLEESRSEVVADREAENEIFGFSL